MTLVAAFLAFIVTALFMFVLRPVADAMGLVDLPGGRKRHGIPVPVIGGICMSIGLGFGAALVEHPTVWTPILLAVYLLIVVGTIDDRFDLPPNVRLIAQTCAALLVTFGSNVVVTSLGSPLFFDVHLGIFAHPFTVVFIVTLINAFNVIDGIDGLAGGLALLSLTALAVIGVTTSVFPLVIILLAVVCGFLLFNFPFGFGRAVRTFMGDAGSTFLGLSIATVGIQLSQGASPRIAPVVGLWLVAVPVFDLFSAIARRVVQGKSLFAPDHEHLHHVLTEQGLSRRRTLVWMLLLAALCASIGVMGDFLAVPDGVMMVLWLVAGVVYYQMLRNPKFVAACARRIAGPRQPTNARPPSDSANQES